MCGGSYDHLKIHVPLSTRSSSVRVEVRGSRFEVNYQLINYQLTRGFDNVQLRPTDTRHVHVFSNMKVER